MKKASSYSLARSEWQWNVPKKFNMGVSICDNQDQNSTALIVPQENGRQVEYTFGELKKQSPRQERVDGLG